MIAVHEQVIVGRTRGGEARDLRVGVGKLTPVAVRIDSGFVCDPICRFVMANDDIKSFVLKCTQRHGRTFVIQRIHILPAMFGHALLKVRTKLHPRFLRHDQRAFSQAVRIQKERSNWKRVKTEVLNHADQLRFGMARKRRANSRNGEAFKHAFQLPRRALSAQPRNLRHDR